MKKSSKVVKHSKILWIILIFFFSSCKECKCNEELPLTLYDSQKYFYVNNSNISFIRATGVWKVTGDNNHRSLITIYMRGSIDVPHSVEIECYKQTESYCNLRETFLLVSDVYKLYSANYMFKINTWDKDKIIATIYKGFDSCLKRILQIDLHTQEVLVKSIPKDNMNSDELCSRYKEKPIPIVNKLVDESESDWEYFISVTKKPKTKK